MPNILPSTADTNRAWWLGQAGFWIDLDGTRILIDPYLSDSLAKKYKGTKFPHTRMMPVPVLPQQLPEPDVLLITHAHTDHMDPETLAVLVDKFPNLPVIVPASEIATARSRTNAHAKLIGVNTHEQLTIGSIEITVFAAAHETRKQDSMGRDHFLGFGLSGRNIRVYHSGDTIPFDGQATDISNYQPDIALLPVNGRDALRTKNGIPGNMSLEEAITLCQECNISILVPQHFGMFEFNTAHPVDIERARGQIRTPEICIPSPLTPIALGSPTN